MVMRNFSVTLSGSGSRSKGNSTETLAYALSVRASSEREEVVTTFTASLPSTGEILRSVSFGIGGKGVLPTPVQLAPIVPKELADTWQSILPNLAALMHQMGSVLDQQRKKGL